MPGKPESKVEIAKRQGRHLRGTIADTLASEATHFGHDDTALLKFHGTYQQDDRDARRSLESAGLEKAYSFMVRVAIPAGAVTGEQYLDLERIADEHGNGTLRVTTRQGFQFHGVLKGDLKPTIAGINHALLTTISACGDVQRNVMGCSAPLGDADHTAIRRVAEALALELRPATHAYYEIWLDGQKQVSTEREEPFYGDRYLPRKFKTAVGLSTDNCVDIWSQDVGLLAVVQDGRIAGFNVLVGGGLGMTHNKGDTTARLAEPLGFVATEHGVEAVRIVAAIFRDHGNRSDRRHAGSSISSPSGGCRGSGRSSSAAPRSCSDRRSRFRRSPSTITSAGTARATGAGSTACSSRAGGSWTRPDTSSRRALHEIVTRLRPGIRLTGQQNLLLTDLDADGIETVERILQAHGVTLPTDLSAVRRFSMACPALPTCGLAVAESERAIPALLDQFEAELDALGLRDAPLTVRMTGCPNGCARPYTADLAFVGRSLGLYNVYVGGGLAGDRLVDLYRADVSTEELLETVRPLLARWATERGEGEGLGDFYQRLMGVRARRTTVTGREHPTMDLIPLEVAR